MKTYTEKLSQEIESLRSEKERESQKYQQLLRATQSRQRSQSDDGAGPCRNCLEMLEEREKLIREIEDLKRGVRKLSDEPSNSNMGQRLNTQGSNISEKRINQSDEIIMQKANQIMAQ